jgi:sugar lactone lactonase YvrE
MLRASLLSILLAAVAALSVWGARAALADEPVTGDAPAVLLAQPSVSEVRDEQSLTLTARLQDGAGAAMSGAPVTFYVLTDVFGERLMNVGEIATDATGTASLVYKPTWEGDHTVVVRYAGSAENAPAQVAFQFNAIGPMAEHEDAAFGLEPIRRWAPIGIGAVVLAVWGTLGLVLLRTVRGIPAAAVPAGMAPMVAPIPQGLRPVPVGPALALVAAVLLLALPGAYFLQRARGGDVSLSTSDVRFSDSNVQHGAGSTPAATLPEQALPATLVRQVELGANLADLPAAVGKVKDRLYILDTNRGRILAVGSDGTPAPIFESEGTGEMSLRGALAMTVHDGWLYVASVQTGDIVVVDSSGRIEGLITPQVPEGQQPLQTAGIAVTPDGDIWLSDVGNHRVLLVNEQGEFLGAIGEGAPSSGEQGFNTPAGLALGAEGNLYVADTANGLVKKYSPMGVFLAAFGEDRLARPQAVAVDAAGTVFVSDDQLMAVLAFGPDGSYLGSIGGKPLAQTATPAWFQAPRGLVVEGSELYVMDRLAGLFVFELGGSSAP